MKLTEKNQLLDRASELNSALEHSYLALALVLVEVEETEAWREAGRDDFVDWYKTDLGREKSTVSRLLTVGKWLKEKYGGGLPEGNPSYKKLAQSIKKNPDAEPDYVLSEALTWTDNDYRSSKKEECKNHEWIEVCKHCWKKKESN